MTEFPDVKRQWDGLESTRVGKVAAKVLTMPRKVERISDLEESDKRVANLLDEPKLTPKQAFEGTVFMVSAFGFLIILWFAAVQK